MFIYSVETLTIVAMAAVVAFYGPEEGAALLATLAGKGRLTDEVIGDASAGCALLGAGFVVGCGMFQVAPKCRRAPR